MLCLWWKNMSGRSSHQGELPCMYIPYSVSWLAGALREYSMYVCSSQDARYRQIFKTRITVPGGGMHVYSLCSLCGYQLRYEHSCGFYFPLKFFLIARAHIQKMYLKLFLYMWYMLYIHVYNIQVYTCIYVYYPWPYIYTCAYAISFGAGFCCHVCMYISYCSQMVWGVWI